MNSTNQVYAIKIYINTIFKITADENDLCSAFAILWGKFKNIFQKKLWPDFSNLLKMMYPLLFSWIPRKKFVYLIMSFFFFWFTFTKSNSISYFLLFCLFLRIK